MSIQILDTPDTVDCPHCPYKFEITSSPEVNFDLVAMHLATDHFEIFYHAIIAGLNAVAD